MTEQEHLNNLIKEIGQENYDLIVETTPSAIELMKPITEGWIGDRFHFICKRCNKEKNTRLKRVISSKICNICKPKERKKSSNEKYSRKKQKDIHQEVDNLRAIGLSYRAIAKELKTSHTNIIRYFKNKEKNDE